jgi:hypothetical protein
MATTTKTTTIPPQDRFWPYSEAEFIELRNVIISITTHIPNDRMGWIWSNHNKINGTNEPQPCSCGSAAGHWRRATDNIRNFVIEKEHLL